MPDSPAPSLLARMSSAWRDLTRAGRAAVTGHVRPNLPDGDIDRVAKQIDACLAATGGEVSARGRAADLGRAYLSLSADGKRRFFTLLLERYGVDAGAARAAAQSVADADQKHFADACANLIKTLEAPRVRLFKMFNSLDEGIKFLVNMRADLLALVRERPELRPVDRDLHRLLESWFDVGFLELRAITWEAPAALLEKLIAYEAVHEIRSWTDLKNRLDSDRRCYAFFHPGMADEPLIFVEVALVDEIAGNVGHLLDEHAPSGDPHAATAAIFYSISNAQKGLAGVSFGDFLIKRVVADLSERLPRLKTFATLSPIPGFRKWLDEALSGDGDILSAAEEAAIGELTRSSEPAGELRKILARADWHEDKKVVETLKPVIMRLCAHYLLEEKRGDRARDPVEHFHLSNGARVERLNWMGDPTANGLKQSAGLMVNYLYKLSDIERNHQLYRHAGKIPASGAVRNL